MKEQAEFRAYADYEASMRDYVDFLESNPRYRGRVGRGGQSRPVC